MQTNIWFVLGNFLFIMNNIEGILLIKIFFNNDKSYALVIYQFSPWKKSHRIGYKTRRIQFTANKRN